MPKRNNIVTKNSDEVQGEGSFVKVKRITLDEAREYQAIVQRQPPPMHEYEDDFDIDEYNDDVEEFNTKKELDARRCISQFVLDWNWVDDNDEPLPKPNNNGDVIGKLTDTEFLFILNTIQTPNSEKKKR